MDAKLSQEFLTGIQLTEEGEEFAKDKERLREVREEAIPCLQSAKGSPAGPLKLIFSGVEVTCFPRHIAEFIEFLRDVIHQKNAVSKMNILSTYHI